VTLACLIVAGYYLLEINLVHGSISESGAIRGAQGAFGQGLRFVERPGDRHPNPGDYGVCVRPVLHSIDNRAGPVRQIFYSTNLRGREIRTSE